MNTSSPKHDFVLNLCKKTGAVKWLTVAWRKAPALAEHLP